MGMFLPQNYGADFTNAMAATAGMINDKARTDMEQQRLNSEQKTRELQQQALSQENEQRQVAIDQQKNVQQYMDLNQRLNAGTLTPDDYQKLTQVTGDIMKAAPYLPSDPKQIPQTKQALENVLSGVDAVRTLPPGNYVYTRADNVPEVDATLDSFRTLLSKDRLGKTFTDTTGSVTGTPGTSYKTNDVGGFAVVSGDGNQAAFTPLFSVTDEKGNQIMNPDGTPKLVPSTDGQSNDPNDPVRLITPDEMRAKAGFAMNVLNTAQQIGLDQPEKARQAILDGIRANMGTRGADELLKNQDALELKKGEIALEEGSQKGQADIQLKQAQAEEASRKNQAEQARQDVENILSTPDEDGHVWHFNLVPPNKDDITPQNLAKVSADALKAVATQEGIDDPDQLRALSEYLKQKQDEQLGQHYKLNEEERRERDTEYKHEAAMARVDAALARLQLARGNAQHIPSEVYTAEWMVKNGVAKDANDAWTKIRTARSNPESLFRSVYSVLAKSNDMKTEDDPSYQSPEALSEKAYGIAMSLANSNQGNGQGAPAGRNIDSLRSYFNTVKSYESNDSAIDNALSKGWTPDEIRGAAKGTPVAKSVNGYDFSSNPAQSSAIPSPVQTQQTPVTRGMTPTTPTKPTTSTPTTASTTVKNGRIVVTGFK